MEAKRKEARLEFLEKYLFMSFVHFGLGRESVRPFYLEVWARTEGIHTI